METSAQIENDNASLVKEILQQVSYPEHMDTSLPLLLKDLKSSFDCEAVILFAVDRSANQLFSIPQCDVDSEIRVAISNNNTAGFAANSGNTLNIENINDVEELAHNHPQLAYESTVDDVLGTTTKSVISVPLPFNQNIIGVLEIINKIGGEYFTEEDLKLAQDISYALGLVLSRLYDDEPEEEEKEIPSVKSMDSVETQLEESEDSIPVLKDLGSEFDDLEVVSEDSEAEMLTEEPSSAPPVNANLSPEWSTKYGYLVKEGLISEEKLSTALTQAESNNLDEESFLLESTGLKRKDLGIALAEYYKHPYYGYQSTIILPKTILGGLNKNYLANNFWLPIESSGTKVVILANSPNDPLVLQNTKQIFQKKEIEFKFGLKVDIIDFLNSLLEQGETQFDQVKTEEMSNLLTSLQEENEDSVIESKFVDDFEDASDSQEVDSTIIRLVNKILIDGFIKKVSDIHIEPGIGKENVLVRFRKDGECFVYEEIPFLYKQAITTRIKIMARLDIAEKRIPQDGKIKMRYQNNNIEFRVATCPTVGGNEDAVLRILAQSKPIPLDSLNFSDKNIEAIKSNIVKPYGLILVVGPTGSGKTTTLHSCLGFINKPNKKIWTAEDPVEITQKGLRQVQTLEKKGVNFARLMRSFLRGDPDVIMVGEMRDKETASIGLEASLTGHLVFSTLHTNSAAETITRLLDMGMNPLNFADSLLLIVGQRLVKTLCKDCKEDYHPTKKEFDIMVKEYGKEAFKSLGIEHNAKLKIKQAVGCESCEDTGYSGRMGIHECVEGTDAIKRLIVKQATVEEIRKAVAKEGLKTLKQDGIQKVFSGDCDLRQVLAVCMV